MPAATLASAGTAPKAAEDRAARGQSPLTGGPASCPSRSLGGFCFCTPGGCKFYPAVGTPVNLTVWRCVIPGPYRSDWDGARIPLELHFGPTYPAEPPKVSFPAGFFHPNVYPSGKVCIPLLNAEKGWRPFVTIAEILLAVVEMLNRPYNSDAAQEPAWKLLNKSPVEYAARVRAEAATYAVSLTDEQSLAALSGPALLVATEAAYQRMERGEVVDVLTTLGLESYEQALFETGGVRGVEDLRHLSLDWLMAPQGGGMRPAEAGRLVAAAAAAGAGEAAR